MMWLLSAANKADIALLQALPVTYNAYCPFFAALFLSNTFYFLAGRSIVCHAPPGKFTFLQLAYCFFLKNASAPTASSIIEGSGIAYLMVSEIRTSSSSP